MLDRHQSEERPGAEGAGRGVSQFAAQVVARLAAREGRADPHRTEIAVREGFLDKLVSAVRSHDPLAIDALTPEIRRARITNAQLADLYIPEAARALGCGWVEDRITFADVTIGTARLQALLRDISADWAADDRVFVPRNAFAGVTLLMVVPDAEQHTLGALVATSQLRRMGISVCLRIGPSVRDLADLLDQRRFDGAMVSVGGEQRLDAGRRMVHRLKSLAKGHFHVAVGGALLQVASGMAEQTGADIATNDLDLALDAFGIRAVSAIERI